MKKVIWNVLALVVFSTACNPSGRVVSPSAPVAPSDPGDPAPTGSALGWASLVQNGAPGGANTSAAAIAVGSAGSTYIVGSTNGALDGGQLHGATDFFLTRYDSSGVREWTIQNGAAPGTTTIAFSVAVDVDGNAYVVGYTTGSLDGQPQMGSWDFFLTKYDSAGVRQWTLQDGSGMGTWTTGLSIAIDTSGRIYVGGFTSGRLDGVRNFGLYSYFLAQYDAAGARNWTLLDGVAGKVAYARSLTVDSAGFVYVAGMTNGGLNGQVQHAIEGYDYFLHKYNSSGSLQWAYQNGGSGSSDTQAYGVAMDTFGNVYVAGYTTGAFDGNDLQGLKDFFVAKFNNGGGWQWTIQDGAPNATVFARGIATDSLGQIYISGTTDAGLHDQAKRGTTDFFVVQFHLGGERQRTFQYGAPGATAKGTGCARDASGNLYVTGYTDGGLDDQVQNGAVDFFAVQLGDSDWN